MKALFIALSVLVSAPAFASNLELAGDCKPAVEAAIESLAPGKADVETILSTEADKIVVGYTREINGRVVSGQARVTLANVIEKAITRNVYLIKCDVVNVQFLN